MMHKQKTKNFSLIAEATKTAVAVLVAGKFETLGSNFSHEIRFCEAAGIRCHSKQFFCFSILRHK